MIIFLILGLVLGAVSVVFVLQNIMPVTVSFIGWHLEASLAVVLFLSLATGVLMTLLFLLPSFVRDEWRYSRLKKQLRVVEGELEEARRKIARPADPVIAPMPPSNPQ